MEKIRNFLNKLSKKDSNEASDVGELFKQLAECSSGNVLTMVRRVLPELNKTVEKFDYVNSTDKLRRHLMLSLWTSTSLLSLTEVESQMQNYENFEIELLKRKVEREHMHVLDNIIYFYGNNDNFLEDFFAFFSFSGIWNRSTLPKYLFDFVPKSVIFIDEFVINISKILLDEYWKNNEQIVNNICNSISSLLVDTRWTSASYGSSLCLEYLLKVFESVYEHEATNMFVIESLMSWMQYFTHRMKEPEHIISVVDMLASWLYYHSKNVYQTVHMTALIFTCCNKYQPQINLNSLFQDVVLCMINSNDLSIVATGYDILIEITDQFNNKQLLDEPKIFNSDGIYKLRRIVRNQDSRLRNQNILSELKDSFQKVILNSIRNYISNLTIGQKVNILVSLIAINGCECAEGLTSVISFALNVQNTMLEMSRYKAKAASKQDSVQLSYNRDTSYYHVCIASWFTLLSYVNKGDLALFKSYVESVVELRREAAPFLLPKFELPPNQQSYIYEMNKLLYFEMDKIQAAIENSWLILSNKKELLNHIKIPHSNLLIEKYVDFQLLDSFDSYKIDEKGDEMNLDNFSIDQDSSIE